MAATATLAGSGALPSWPGLVHAVALPPLDLAMDVRVLVAGAPTYPQLLIGLAVSLVVRTALLGTLFVTLGVTSSPRAGIAYAARLYAAALVPVTLAAALEFSGLAALYAWYAWSGLGLTALVALILIPRRLGRPGTRIRRYPLVFGYLAALMAIGALARAGTWGIVIGVVASAMLTAVVLSWLVSRRPGHTRGVAAATVLLLMGALVVPGAAAQVPTAVHASLLVVPGVDTSSGYGAAYRLDPSALGLPCERVFYFSYRGPGEGAPQGEAACPIRLHRPYAEETTQRPIGELVDAFALQLEAIRRETGDSPVVVVTHSQGAVIAWRAAARGRAEGVSHLIALGGFPHSPVGYPPPGLAGPGRVGADALRVLSWLSRVFELGTFDPDAPLAREILARSDGLESVFGEPLPPTTKGTLLFAAADVIAAPEGRTIPDSLTITIGTTHVGITESARAEVALREILGGGAPSGDSALAAILDAVLPAFMPPPAG